MELDAWERDMMNLFEYHQLLLEEKKFDSKLFVLVTLSDGKEILCFKEFTTGRTGALASTTLFTSHCPYTQQAEQYLQFLYVKKLKITYDTVLLFLAISLEFCDDLLKIECEKLWGTLSLYSKCLIVFDDHLVHGLEKYIDPVKEELARVINPVLCNNFHLEWPYQLFSKVITLPKMNILEENFVTEIYNWYKFDREKRMVHLDSLLKCIEWHNLEFSKVYAIVSDLASTYENSEEFLQHILWSHYDGRRDMQGLRVENWQALEKTWFVKVEEDGKLVDIHKVSIIQKDETYNQLVRKYVDAGLTINGKKYQMSTPTSSNFVQSFFTISPLPEWPPETNGQKYPNRYFEKEITKISVPLTLNRMEYWHRVEKNVPAWGMIVCSKNRSNLYLDHAIAQYYGGILKEIFSNDNFIEGQTKIMGENDPLIVNVIQCMYTGQMNRQRLSDIEGCLKLYHKFKFTFRSFLAAVENNLHFISLPVERIWWWFEYSCDNNMQNSMGRLKRQILGQFNEFLPELFKDIKHSTIMTMCPNKGEHECFLIIVFNWISVDISRATYLDGFLDMIDFKEIASQYSLHVWVKNTNNERMPENIRPLFKKSIKYNQSVFKAYEPTTAGHKLPGTPISTLPPKEIN